jgi:hypothetical protein
MKTELVREERKEMGTERRDESGSCYSIYNGAMQSSLGWRDEGGRSLFPWSAIRIMGRL